MESIIDLSLIMSIINHDQSSHLVKSIINHGSMFTSAGDDLIPSFLTKLAEHLQPNIGVQALNLPRRCCSPKSPWPSLLDKSPNARCGVQVEDADVWLFSNG